MKTVYTRMTNKDEIGCIAFIICSNIHGNVYTENLIYLFQR